MISPLRRILFDHFSFQSPSAVDFHIIYIQWLYSHRNISKIWKEMESDLDGRESKEESEVHLEGMTNGTVD